MRLLVDLESRRDWYRAEADLCERVAPPLHADACFHRCECGHSVYDHGRLGKDGNQLWVGCRSKHCECSTFRASDGTSWPNNFAGATLDDPTDLDVNTDHWIDGQVYLSTDEPPL